MPVIAKTVVLLVLSNIFMTFAWYAICGISVIVPGSSPRW